jgi:RimJ/RimL family protein N-acetyltransferase
VKGDVTDFEPVPDVRPADLAWPAVTWPPPAGTVLAGEHVELRPTTPDDALPLFDALDDTHAWEHIPTEQPYRVHVMRQLVDDAIATRFPWTVRRRTSSEIVGWTSYLDTSAHDARTEIGSTQYAPRVWGTDVNPETKLLLLTFAFEELGFGRVQLKTDVRNERSQRAIARLGARYEGTLRRYQRRADGTVRDTALFSVTAEDWPQVRAGLLARLGRTA